jgi:hypothetical protein
MPDPFSALGNVLGGGVKDLAGGVFNALSQWLWGAGLEILKAGVGLADKFGSVNLDVHSGPMAAVWSVTLPIGLAIAGCIFYFSLATVPFQGRGGVLRAVRGVGQFGVALAGSIGAFASLLALSDAFTSFILSKGLSSANFDEAFTHTGFSDATANAVKGGALALMSLFGVIPIGLGFAFENVMRAATIYLLAAVIPITAAGLLSGNTASWYWKTAHWMMAAIAMKPVMALALALGVGIAGGGQGLVALIVGLAVLFVALFAPLALFRLFAFASEKATDGFKSGWSSSGAEDAVHGATDKVTSMVSGSDSTSSMESSTDARYSDASSDTDTGTGDSTGAGGSNSAGDTSSTGDAGGGGEQMGGTASEAVSAETGSDTPGTNTDRQQQAPGGDEQGANGTGETADAHAVQQGDVAATAPADVPGEGGTDSPPAPDAAGASQQPSQQPAEQGAGSGAQQPAEQGAGSGAQQPAEQGAGSGAQQPAGQGAGSGAQQEQMPAPPTPAGGGSGEQSPAPSSSAGGAGDGAQAPGAPSSSGGSGDGAQAPGAPPGSSGGAPAPQPFANDAARSGDGGNAGSSGGGASGSGGGAAGGAGAGDAAAAAAV